MSIGVFMFFRISILGSFGYIPRSGITGSKGRSIFICLRYLHTVSHSGFTSLHSHQQCKKAPLYPHPCQPYCVLTYLLVGLEFVLELTKVLHRLSACTWMYHHGDNGLWPGVYAMTTEQQKEEHSLPLSTIFVSFSTTLLICKHNMLFFLETKTRVTWSYPLLLKPNIIIENYLKLSVRDI